MIKSAAYFAIQKHTKRDDISPRDIQMRPEFALGELLQGFVVAGERFQSPTGRGLYGVEHSSGWRTGANTYHVQLVIPEDKRYKFSDISLRRDSGLFDEEEVGVSSVADFGVRGEFSQIVIPQHRLRELLPYVSIFGGQTEGNRPLEEVYVGVFARDIVEGYLGEARPRGFVC